MKDIKLNAEQAATKVIPYDKNVAATYPDVKKYADFIAFKRSLFINGYMCCHKEENKDVVFDESTLCGIINGERIQFSSLESVVFSLLLSNRGVVICKNEISKAGWDGGFLISDNSIRVVMSRIRKKVGKGTIKAIPRRGYIFVD